MAQNIVVLPGVYEIEGIRENETTLDRLDHAIMHWTFSNATIRTTSEAVEARIWDFGAEEFYVDGSGTFESSTGAVMYGSEYIGTFTAKSLNADEAWNVDYGNYTCQVDDVYGDFGQLGAACLIKNTRLHGIVNYGNNGYPPLPWEMRDCTILSSSGAAFRVITPEIETVTMTRCFLSTEDGSPSITSIYPITIVASGCTANEPVGAGVTISPTNGLVII